MHFVDIHKRNNKKTIIGPITPFFAHYDVRTCFYLDSNLCKRKIEVKIVFVVASDLAPPS